METFEITPKVNQAQEFAEIANDFSNPLELVREAISNSFDAEAKNISVSFFVDKVVGEDILRIEIEDDGNGMSLDGLQSFFDLGNSSRKGNEHKIGEKGHGTKVYFRSQKIYVETICNGIKSKASIDHPLKTLSLNQIPKVIVSQEKAEGLPNGTRLIITGYNNSKRSVFTHENLKDYIFWKTKFGSIENVFNHTSRRETKLKLLGLGAKTPELLTFGHFFPPESESIQKLFEKHVVKAPDYYCKRIIKSGVLKNHPEIEYEAIFSVEGSRVKYNSNPMLRRPGYQAPEFSYTISERYGLWLCKDYIPIQDKNIWIGTRGTEHTRLHAFINCQGLNLTANRGSCDNTPSDVLQDLKDICFSIFEEIQDGEAWRDIQYLESEAEAYISTDREAKDFSLRHKEALAKNVATFKNVELVEPRQENGVYGLLVILLQLEPTLFPFEIVDYDTHKGIDLLVRTNKTIPVHQSKLFYVELKRYLQEKINHSFLNTFVIICWDTTVKDDEEVTDINGQTRKMKIIAPSKSGEYRKYNLIDFKGSHNIEVFVLKDYLKDVLGLEFRPRIIS